MASPDPIAAERAHYLALLGRTVDDPAVTLSQLRAMTGAGVELETATASKSSLDQKVRDAVKVDGSLKVLLGSGTDTAPALTNAAIKVASLRALNKLTVAEMGANAGPILNRLINIMIDIVTYDRQNGKLTVNLFDEAQQ